MYTLLLVPGMNVLALNVQAIRKAKLHNNRVSSCRAKAR